MFFNYLFHHILDLYSENGNFSIHRPSNNWCPVEGQCEEDSSEVLSWVILGFTSSVLVGLDVLFNSGILLYSISDCKYLRRKYISSNGRIFSTGPFLNLRLFLHMFKKNPTSDNYFRIDPPHYWFWSERIACAVIELSVHY